MLARATASRFDASTLGKIEVSGPDAARFLDRIYIQSWQNLGVGHCRYGVMCREDGMYSTMASAPVSRRTGSS